MFKIKKKNKIAAYDETSNKHLTYLDLIKLSKIKIFKKSKKLIILILAENSLGCLASYFCSIQNHNLTILTNKDISIFEFNKLEKK